MTREASPRSAACLCLGKGHTDIMDRLPHPEILTSLSIIRTHPENDPRSVISSLALFTITRSGRCEAVFDIEHHFFDPTDTQADILRGVVRSIPMDAVVLLRQYPPLAPWMRDESDAAEPLNPPTDVQFLARELDTAAVIGFEVDDHEIAEAGLALGIHLPGSASTPMRWRRRATLHAQAMWVIYCASFCPPNEQRALLAAHIAWRALQRAQLGVGAG